MENEQTLNTIEKARSRGIWTFFRDGVPEDVAVERWAWGVVYEDDTELHQFDGNGVFHQFAEVDQKRVKMFCIFTMGAEGAKPAKRIDIVVDPAVTQLFYFYRNVRPHYATDFRRVYVFGWKKRDTGECSYHYILPDDRLIMSDRDSIDLPTFNV